MSVLLKSLSSCSNSCCCLAMVELEIVGIEMAVVVLEAVVVLLWYCSNFAGEFVLQESMVKVRVAIFYIVGVVPLLIE